MKCLSTSNIYTYEYHYIFDFLIYMLQHIFYSNVTINTFNISNAFRTFYDFFVLFNYNIITMSELLYVKINR